MTVEALRNELLGLLLRELQSAVVVYEPVDDGDDFVIRMVSDSVANIEGIPRARLLGARVRVLFPGVERSGILEALRRVWTSGQPEDLEPVLYNDERIEGWRRNRVFRMSGGWIAALYDDVDSTVALQRALERRERPAREILQHIEAGIILVDAATREIVDANPAALAMMGRDREDVVGRRCHALICPTEDGACPVLDLGRCVDNEQRTLLTRDGPRSVIKTVARVELDGRPCLVETIIDNMARQRALEALQDSEERLDLAMRGASDGLWDWHLPSDRVYFSPRWKGMLGYSDDQVVNSWEAWERLAHPEDVQRVRARMDALLASTLETLDLELRMRHAQGHWVWIQVSAACMRGDDARPLRVAGSFTDVTASKHAVAQLEMSQRKLDVIDEYALDGVIMMDAAGAISFWSRAAERIFGYRASEVLGRDLHTLLAPGRFHDAQTQAFPHFMQTGQGAAVGELVVVAGIHKDGHEVPIELALSSVKESDGWGAVAVVRDVEQRLEAERELRRAKDLAEAATRAKSMFLATMSHEIRSPLNAVIGMTDLTLGSSLEPQQRENLEIAKRSAGLLLDLINDILDFSRIEAGHTVLEERNFHLLELVDAVVASLSVRAGQVGLRLTTEAQLDTLPWLRGDARRVQQILVNLVANAIKFTPAGSVQVITRSEPLGADRVGLQISVRDTGIGIPADQLERVFETFQQVDGSTTRNYQGSGLGLAISRKLARLMGGDVEVSSTPGQGSHFTVRVVVQPGEPEDRDLPDDCARVEAAVPGYPPRILLVEDKLFNQKVAQQYLGRMGCQVVIAEDGAQAIAALETDRFDLVFMDIQMPVMDGVQATRAWRAREEREGRERTPIVAMTADAFAEDRERCLAAGMEDFLTKPVDPSKLEVAVRRWGASSSAGSPRQVEVPLQAGERSELYAAILDRCDGDVDFMAELAELFAEDGDAELQRLGAALERGDVADARQAAHAVTGMSGNLGASGLEASVRALHARLRLDDVAGAVALLASVMREYGKVLEVFGPLRGGVR